MPALKKAAVVFALCLLLNALPAFAQEATPEAAPAAAETTEAPPAGLSTLILLLGAGAVLLVGGVMVARDRFSGGQAA
jgi:hypothetical protein